MTDERWTLPALTAADRCDFTCGAAAAVRVIFSTGDLYACGHHYEADQLSLEATSVYVQDERGAAPAAPTTPGEPLEDLGRMHMRRGLTHADPCRWCTRRLVLRRFHDAVHNTWRDYFVCEHCDETAALDMHTLRDL